MNPDQFAERMQALADKGHMAQSVAQKAAVAAMAQVKAPGHTVLGSESVVRVSGPRAGFVARAMQRKASVAAAKALKGALK